MKLQIVLFILMTITLISCKKEPIEPKEKIGFFLFARQSDFVWVDNIRGEIIKADDVSAIYRSPLKTNSNVKYVEFILGISTCNVDIDEITIPNYQQAFSSDNYNPLSNAPYMALSKSSTPMANAADPTIESEIKQYLATKYNGSDVVSSLPKAVLEHIDYRITPLKNIKITCSKDLFGVKAGDILNEYFVIAGYPSYHDFIISSNKQLVSGKTTDISLSQYLSYQPMAPAGMYMQIKKGVSIPASITAEFTVELELEGDKTISATTKPITLIP